MVRIPALALAAAFALSACSPLAIRTAQVAADACDLALLSGSLERQAQTGLGVGGPDGVVTPVQWPFGYAARVEANGAVLLDGSGKVVAHEHDRVNVGGGLGDGAIWFACGQVTVESNAGG